MTRLTRKLMISILTVVLSISALGTTTFAWFTVTNVASVENFSAQIVSDTGIEVSLDGINWYNSLNETMINDYIEDKYTSFRFNHVTSTNGETFKTLGSESLPDASFGSYLELVVFFRSTSVPTLTWTSVSLSGETVQWYPDVTFNIPSGVATPAAQINVNPANAIRISVVSPEDTFTSNPVYELGSAVFSNTVLGSGGDLSNGGIGDPGAMNYYYVKSGTDTLPYGLGSWVGDPAVWTPTDVVVASSVTNLGDLTSNVVMNFADTTQGSITYDAGGFFVTERTVNYNAAKGGYIVVNIWFEGYDAEAYNALLDLPVIMGLTFTGAM